MEFSLFHDQHPIKNPVCWKPEVRMRWVWWEGLMRTWWWVNNNAWVVADHELSMNVN